MLKRRPITGTAADPTMEFAPLEIDGQTYNLAFDFYGLAKAEQAINGLRTPLEEKCNLMHGLGTLMVNALMLDVRQTLGLFYGAMLPTRPEMTLETVARLIRIETVPDIQQAIIAAYNLSMKGAKKDSDPPVGADAAPVAN